MPLLELAVLVEGGEQARVVAGVVGQGVVEARIATVEMNAGYLEVKRYFNGETLEAEGGNGRPEGTGDEGSTARAEDEADTVHGCLDAGQLLHARRGERQIMSRRRVGNYVRCGDEGVG